MPDRALMTVLLTDDIESAARFLAEVVGMGEGRWFPSSGALAGRLFGWPDGAEDARRVVFGRAPGIVEVVEIPPSLRDRVGPGIGFVGFATPDVGARGAAAAGAGFPPGPTLEAEGTTVVPVQVGGLPFAFLRF